LTFEYTSWQEGRVREGEKEREGEREYREFESIPSSALPWSSWREMMHQQSTQADT
jgi:hypothetical protein